MQPETYAQWQNGQPINERPQSQIRIPNTNHQAHRMTPEQLAQVGWYRVLRIELGEGERLDNESWSLGNHSITQIGTIIDAETVAAEKQAARMAELERMTQDYDTDVAILGIQLAKFDDPETGLPYQMPIDAGKVITEIKTGLATGAIPDTMIDAAKTLEGLYRDLRQVMTHADIAAVASIIGGEE